MSKKIKMGEELKNTEKEHRCSSLVEISLPNLRRLSPEAVRQELLESGGLKGCSNELEFLTKLEILEGNQQQKEEIRVGGPRCDSLITMRIPKLKEGGPGPEAESLEKSLHFSNRKAP